jgi:dTDP-4-dehydrorhamnose 3,5-epimerase
MAISIEKTDIPGIVIITPRTFSDERGSFFESFNQREFNLAVESDEFTFVQDNHSTSRRGVLRGLHHQNPRPQGKLVRVVRGAVFDVAVDIREGSRTFGNWVGLELSAENRRQLWVPPGFAHGFLVLSETAEFLYKTTDYYAPECEKIVRYDDPAIGISWPELDIPYLLSEKDANAELLRA